ncbi:MAG TPA: toxin glutamine deamidase domain-containing protein, partial [Bryobacteraceae bacterium]|nr:toxin glutamine deamidase domain-containing protein [Bryobacteraceae bacterium]
MASPDAKHLQDIKDLLNQCPAGAEAVAYIEKHKIPVVFDTGGGGSDWDGKQIRIDRSQPVHMAALTLVHEVNHAEWDKTGKTANIHTETQKSYIDKNIEEESVGTAKAIEAQRQLERLGEKFPQRYPLYWSYTNAYNRAAGEHRRQHPAASLSDHVKAAQQAGLDAVRKGFNDGKVVASNTTAQTTYRDYYAQDWTNVRGPAPPSKSAGPGPQVAGLQVAAAAALATQSAHPDPRAAGGDWLAQIKHGVGEGLQAANAGLEPFARQLQSAQQVSRRAADAVAIPTKAAIRNSLETADRIVGYLPVQDWAKASRKEADKFERFAKESGLEDTANAVQMVEGGVWVWKGGVKVFQALKNPEVRAALSNVVRRAPDAADTARQITTRMSAFRAAQNEQRALVAAKALQSPAARQAEKTAGDQLSHLMAMRREAGRQKIVDDANQLLQKIHTDRNPGVDPSNCTSCAIATYFKFHGKNVIASSDHLPKFPHEMEDFFRAKFGPLPHEPGYPLAANDPRFKFQDTNIRDVVEQLRNGKHGDCGVLGYSHPTGNGPGHAIFAANVNGHVVFLDGQAGRCLSLQEVSGKVDYKFLKLPPPEGAKPVIGLPEPPAPPRQAGSAVPQPPVPPGMTPSVGHSAPFGGMPRTAEGGQGIPPGGRPPAAPPGAPPPGGPPWGPRPFGMRPQDMQVFQDAAREHNRWIIVRSTNPESLKYIGEPGFSPKRIDCKANTANVPGHPQAGLVVDPHIHPSAYLDPAAAQARWEEMLHNGRLPEGYSVNYDPHSPQYGCLQHNGQYIHGDYDIYDIIDPHRPTANLSLVTELHGERHMQGPGLADLGNHLNDRLGSPMVRHGGELQWRDHSNQHVMVFGPNGERFEREGERQLRALYEERFGGRRGFDHANAPPPGGSQSPGGWGGQKSDPVRHIGQDQPASPTLLPERETAGQKADKLTARMVAEGYDPHLAARNVEKGLDPRHGQKEPPGGFRGPEAGRLADEDYRRRHDAAQFEQRRERDLQEQQQRIQKIDADRQGHEAKMQEKFARDVKAAERQEEKKEQKAEHKEHDKEKKEEKREAQEKREREKDEKEKRETQEKDKAQEQRQGQERKDSVEEQKRSQEKDAKAQEGAAGKDSVEGQKQSQEKDAKAQEQRQGQERDAKGTTGKDSVEGQKQSQEKDAKAQEQRQGQERDAKGTTGKDSVEEQKQSQEKDAKASAQKPPEQTPTPGKDNKPPDSQDPRKAAEQGKTLAEGQGRDGKPEPSSQQSGAR